MPSPNELHQINQQIVKLPDVNKWFWGLREKVGIAT